MYAIDITSARRYSDRACAFGLFVRLFVTLVVIVRFSESKSPSFMKFGTERSASVESIVIFQRSRSKFKVKIFQL